jgi:hypothetical protein
MNNLKIKLPKKSIFTLYQFKTGNHRSPDTTTQSQGDPTNTCTTIFTTTHFIPR